MKKIIICLLLVSLAPLTSHAQCNANFAAYASPSNDGTVTFVDSSTHFFSVNYFWNFGDGSVDYNSNPTHTFSYSGMFNVCLTISDSINGCSSTFCDSVYVNNTMSPCSANFYYYRDSTGSTIFVDQSTGSMLSYTWTFGDGTTSNTAGAQLHTYPGPGVYYACLSISGSSGSCTDVQCDTILVTSCTATYTYTSDSTGTTFSFTSVVTGSPDTYFWNFGDGTTSTLANPVHTYSANGWYPVSLSTTSSTDSACSGAYSSTVDVNGYCDGTFYGYRDTTYTSNTYLFSAYHPGNAATTYYWNFGDGSAQQVTSTGSVTHTYTTAGNFNVEMYVVNSALMCSDTSNFNAFVSSCSASFTYAFDPSGNGCTFTSAAGTADTYNWDFGDGTTSTLANPYHVFSNNGYYYVQLTTSSSTDSTCYSMHAENIYAAGVCDASFNVIQDSTNAYNYIVYSNSYGSGSTTYLWDFGDGSTSTLQYPVHTYPAATAYYLCLTVSDASGCTDTHCDTLNPGHGGGQISVTVLPAVTGIQEAQNQNISLENFPNPFIGSTSISYSLSQDASVELSVYDLLGNRTAIIESARRSSGSYNATWNAENIAPGMYLLQMKVDNKLITRKIIISK